ncbi:putative disease resistance protein RGA3 [Telopea speciosissima]|uniref:putative disease resistance protein RGA3 n=1 Tax=Telopea speciosissima TaxID=54955 RepID=UPI001CC57B87|nr:putative disease resistance protein RGA3 [Telopea speciosissima]
MVFHFHIKEADELNHPTPLGLTFNEKAQELRTLYMQSNFEMGISSIGRGYQLKQFVSTFQGLRVLKLSGLRMSEVPWSIGNQLEQLRYLDLCGNNFRELPNSICRLYKLQTLRLEGCKEFEEWPTSSVMTKMVNLRHLELGLDPSIKYMPLGLGQLSSLQTLGCFIVGNGEPDLLRGLFPRRRKEMINKDMIGGGLGELHGLNQLGGELAIKELRNVKDVRDAKEANLKLKSELQSLTLSWSSGHSWTRVLSVADEEQVLEDLQPHPNLKALKIEWYEGFKMSSWMIYSSSLLPNLVELTLWSCSNLYYLPLIGEFPCLRRLCLKKLDALKSIYNIVFVTEG